jgi:hypothetical protein
MTEANAQEEEPHWEGSPDSSRRLTRMEQATKEAEGTFHSLVAPKGKKAITRWEKELKDKRKGKEWDDLLREADWVTDLGATRPRETLYHKTIEMAWLTKMLIGKVHSEKAEARQEDNRENKPMLDEILCHLNSLETIIKLLVEVEKDQKCKLERWRLSSTCTYAMFIIWTSRLSMDKVRQPKSGRLARSPRRKITRARRMAGRSTPRC